MKRPRFARNIVRVVLRHVVRVLRRARRRAPEEGGDAVAAARHAVRALGTGPDSARPVLAGPWLAELGYELLYWIPFLRRATQTIPGLADRLVVISRGGVESWYEGVAARYVELYERIDPIELRASLEAIAAETGGYRKQYRETSLDRRILARVCTELGLENAALLHPSIMFGAYRTLAKQSAVTRTKGSIFSHAPLHATQAELDLPRGYVAVRFYFSPAFPDTPDNRGIVAEVVQAIASRRPVVILAPPGSFDEHVDAIVEADVPVRRLDRMTSANNLAVQSAAIAGASAFVSTYGGLSYVGPLLGVPTVALYSEPLRFRPQHLELAQRVFRGEEYGGFVALDVGHLPLLEALLARGAEPSIAGAPS